MVNPNKYKIEVRQYRRNAESRKREVVPLPEDKVTGLSWPELVRVIAENGIEIVDVIRLHNVGQKRGTRMLNPRELLFLWHCVESSRNERDRGN